MTSKRTFEANDKKTGMSLEELQRAVERFAADAEINETDKSAAKVNVMINFNGGIKAITAEV